MESKLHHAFQVALALVLLVILTSATPGTHHLAQAGSPTLLMVMDDLAFLTAEPDFYAGEIQALLEAQHHPLANYHETIEGQAFRAADLIWMASQTEEYGLNPKVLLIFALQNQIPFQNGQFLPAVTAFARSLWLDQLAFQTGQTSSILSSGQVVDFANGASYAIAHRLAGQADPQIPLEQLTAGWAARYQQVFGVIPTEPLILAPAATQPILRRPFNNPSNSFYTVNSFFDHDYPGDHTNYTLRFDGQNLYGSVTSCELGYSCYSGHNAIDYNLPAWTPVYAAATGRVVSLNPSQGGVIIDHNNGYRTIYWHLNAIEVSLNDWVNAGQRIGKSGNKGISYGPHLHFGFRRTSGSKDIDPFGWWSSSNDPWGSSVWMWQGDLTADNRESQAQLFSRTFWTRDGAGFQGESWYTLSTTDPSQSRNWAIWGAFIDTPGDYEVFGYWPRREANTTSARYKVFHAGGSTTVSVNQQSTGDQWVSLGIYAFDQGPAAVILTDLAGDQGKRVYFDAIQWQPANQSVLNTTATLAGTLGENGWYTSTVTATLTAVNSGSGGVALIEYWLDNDSPQTQPGDTATVIIATDRAHVLHYRAQDTLGNWESEKQTSIWIDQTAPLITSFQINENRPYVFTIVCQLGLSASDATSEVAVIRVRNNAAPWGDWVALPEVLDWSLPPVTGVYHTVRIQVKDTAGNVSAMAQDSILLNIYPDRPTSANYRLPRSTFGSSGSATFSPNFQIKSTFGQLTIPGSSSSFGYALFSGYWSPTPIVTFQEIYLPMIRK